MDEKTKTQLDTEDVEPVSIQRLRAIRPGQEVCYYAGELAHDIEAARVDSPDYARLLGRIAHLALELQQCGRVRLVKREIRRGGATGSAVKVVEYVAVGLLARGLS
jgi:hypothetical protein